LAIFLGSELIVEAVAEIKIAIRSRIREELGKPERAVNPTHLLIMKIG